MFEIKLKNNKIFTCDKDSTIFDAAKKAGIILDHSCLNARCRSCIVKVTAGSVEEVENELVLTENEKKENFVLSCNSKPLSDLKLDIEDLRDIKFFDKKIVPAKISKIKKIKSDVLEIILRLPPSSNFQFNAGQYVNIIKDKFKRSYSLANKPSNDKQLEFLIKRYGKWIDEQILKKLDYDLLRIEGPLGAFF